MLQHCGFDSQFRNIGISVQNQKKKKGDEIKLPVPQRGWENVLGSARDWTCRVSPLILPGCPPSHKSHPSAFLPCLRSPFSSAPRNCCFPHQNHSALSGKTAQEGAERSSAPTQSLQAEVKSLSTALWG